MNPNKKTPKNPKNYFCKICDFYTSNKKDFDRHKLTDKHIILTNPNKKTPKTPFYTCNCGKVYKHHSSLCAHKKKCNIITETGSIVEKGPTASIFSNPKHAYTRLLLESTPSVVGEKKKLRALDGEPPSLINGLEGCAFSPRCPEPSEDCKSKKLDMSLIEIENGHWADQCCVNCG